MYAGDPRWITTRFSGTCRQCYGEIARDARAWFYPARRRSHSRLYCEPCGAPMAREFRALVEDEDFMMRQFAHGYGEA